LVPSIAGAETYQIAVAAATAVLNYDMLTTRRDIVSDGRLRGLLAVGLTGSAAAGDSAVDVKSNTRILTSVQNRATGSPGADTDMFPVDAIIPPSEALNAPVTDAPAVNPLILALAIQRA
jgi:hypothetical protein